VHWTSSSIALTLSAAFLLSAAAASAQTPPPALAPGEIARVADTPILKTEYDHWVPIAQKTSWSGDLPDESAVRPQVMQLLISFRWIEGEAARVGVEVKPGAVYTSYKRQKDISFPSEKAFQKFLETSGQTVADIKFRVRLDLLSNKLRDRAIPAPRPVGARSVSWAAM
jgi:hypothetical protein